MTPLVPLLGLGMGVLLGVFGAGGSIVAVPVFVYLLGYEVEQAVAMSLIVVGLAGVFGAARAWRAGQVRLGAALRLGAVAMLGAYGGARAAPLVGDSLQMTVFAVAVLSAARLMLRSGTSAPRGAPTEGDAPPPDGASVPLLVSALGVGVVTGLIGMGGGFLLVPALVSLGRVPMATAAGTSLVLIAMNAAAALVGHAGHFDPPWGVLAVLTACAVAGVLLGSRLGHSIPQPALRRAFAVFLLLVGGFVLLGNRILHPAVAPGPHVTAPGAHG
jgi:uncharacterized protein